MYENIEKSIQRHYCNVQREAEETRSTAKRWTSTEKKRWKGVRSRRGEAGAAGSGVYSARFVSTREGVWQKD